MKSQAKMADIWTCAMRSSSERSKDSLPYLVTSCLLKIVFWGVYDISRDKVTKWLNQNLTVYFTNLKVLHDAIRVWGMYSTHVMRLLSIQHGRAQQLLHNIYIYNIWSLLLYICMRF